MMISWISSRFGKRPHFTGNNLLEFLRFMGQEGPRIPMPPADGFWWHDGLAGVTLFREGAFQAQLYICKPLSTIPEHSHPNVDSFEVNVGGDLRFMIKGKQTIPDEWRKLERNGMSRWNGDGVFVGAGVEHSLIVGPTGAAFLSVQHWLNGPAQRSVGLDWQGAVCDSLHEQQLATKVKGAVE